MPPRGKTKAAAAETEPDYTAYANKPPTDLQERFAAWIPEVTEYDPSSAKTKQEAFEEGVRLGTALRMEFQRSPENQELLKEKKAAAAAKKAEPKVPGKRGRKPKAAVEEEVEPEEADVEEDEEDEEEAPPPPKRATRRKATGSASKSSGRRKAAAGADAPF
jgi:hypothetical protein